MGLPRDQAISDLMRVLLGNVRRRHSERCQRSAPVTPRVYVQPRSQPGRLADVNDSVTFSDAVSTWRIRCINLIKLMPFRSLKPHSAVGRMSETRGRLYVVGRYLKAMPSATSFSISVFHIVRMKVPVIAECGSTGFQSVLPGKPAFKCLPVLNVSIARDS